MKTVFLLTLTVILISCSTNQISNQNELLTSIQWTVEAPSLANGEKPSLKETYRFFNDGTYTLQTEDVGVNGKWSWSSDIEIYLEEKEIVIGGQTHKFDASNNHYIRVIEISDKILRAVKRHEGDSWDSGFAKEIKYIPEV